MELLDVALLCIRLKEHEDTKDLNSKFQDGLEKRFAIFGLSVKDFKINNEYDFSKKTAEILCEIYQFKLKRYVSNLKKGELEKIDTTEFNELSKLVRMAVKSHFTDKDVVKNFLLKINAVTAEVGIFDERLLKSISLFNYLDPKVKEVAKDDIRILFLEVFSNARYPNLSDTDRIELFTDFLGHIESEVQDYLERLKEWDKFRVENKDLSTIEVRKSIIGDY